MERPKVERYFIDHKSGVVEPDEAGNWCQADRVSTLEGYAIGLERELAVLQKKYEKHNK